MAVPLISRGGIGCIVILLARKNLREFSISFPEKSFFAPWL
jgi:hypothetical protein